MASQLRFHPDTATDLSASTAYYDEISQQVGGRFRDAIGEQFRTIVERPASFARIRNQQRAALVHGFPFVIVFEKTSDDFITVLGVFHAASDQSGWFSRSV